VLCCRDTCIFMPVDLHCADAGLQNSSYLEGAAYSQQMAQWVAAAQPIVAGSLRHDCSTRHQHQQQDEEDLVVHYHDEKSFRRIASSLYPMMPDLKVRLRLTRLDTAHCARQVGSASNSFLRGCIQSHPGPLPPSLCRPPDTVCCPLSAFRT
jgi:hypothetical protein